MISPSQPHAALSQHPPRRRHRLAAAVVAALWSASALPPAVGQTLVSPGEVLDQYGPVNLGALSMQGGTIIFRDSPQFPSTATGSILANGWIAAAGYPARIEFFGDTKVPGASFGLTFPTDAMTIAASGSENLYPLDAINNGQFFQTGNGVLTLGGAARFVNNVGGAYWIQNDLGMRRTSTAAVVSFVNRGGSLIKASGNGTSFFDMPVIQEGGKVETWTGTLYLGEGGIHNSANLYADGLGDNQSQYGIILAGAHTFTGIVTTDMGSLYLGQLGRSSRIDLAPSADATGFVAGEWQQKANFRVEGIQSRVDIRPGAALHNTGTLVTDSFGALVAVGALPSATGSPARGQLLNDQFFQGAILGTLDYATGPCVRNTFQGDYCVIDVRNTRGAEFVFQPAALADPNAPVFDPVSEINTVGVFRNSGRVRVPGIVDPLNGIPVRVVADEFLQDQQGAAVLNGTPELVIDRDGELQVGHFRQTAGDTTVNGHLLGNLVQFVGGTLGGTGTITHNQSFSSAIATGDVTIRPGTSPGTLTIDGNLDADGTVFDIEIGGRIAGLEYDQLVVLGQANLTNSILNLRFINGFVPASGDVFDWLVADDPLVGQEPLTVNVSSDLAVIAGESDGRRFIVSSVSPVPLPPAAWLMSAGLLIVVGMARRRQAWLPRGCASSPRQFRS